MAERRLWTGSAVDLMHLGVGCNSNGTSRDGTGWPKNPRALAGRLRRAQTFLRILGIEITFSREGRAGNRIITIRRPLENTVSTVSTVSSIRDNEATAEGFGCVTAVPDQDFTALKSIEASAVQTVRVQPSASPDRGSRRDQSCVPPPKRNCWTRS
jgi:hypothetical protein